MNDNLVKTLREKTEEANLDTILKKKFGGYSCKSVQEYISMLRQQQCDMQQSFAEKLQISQAERDRLAQELAKASKRAADAEEALEELKPLLEKNAALEKDMEEAVERIQEDAIRLEQLGQELERQKVQVQQLQSERNDLLGCLERGDGQKDELTMKQEQNEGEQPQQEQLEGDAEIHVEPVTADLSEWPEDMQLQLAMLARERKNTVRQIESVLHREGSLFQVLNQCWTELESRRDRNKCLEAENEALSCRLAQQMDQNISLGREIVHMKTINDSLKQKLEAALKEAAKDNTPEELHHAGDMFQWDFEE